MACVYTFKNGDVVRGKPALKAYLTANLATLLPSRAPEFARTPIQAAMSKDMQESIRRVEQVVANQTERWANSPNVIVTADMNDPRIPRYIRESEERQSAANPALGKVRGFYNEGNIYLIASQLQSDMDAAQVLFHEGLGHVGLRGLYGEALNSVLQQIVALRRADVIAKAKSYGLDVNNPEDMLHAAEEVLASMAEKTPTIGFVKRAVAAIRTWLRQNMPGFAAMELSDAEIIRDYLLPARAFVENGAQAAKQMAGRSAFSRANKLRSSYQWGQTAKNDKGPVYQGGSFVLDPVTKLSHETDFDANGMMEHGLMGHAAHVTEGADVYMFAILQGQKKAGHLVADVKDGKIVAIHDLDVYSKKKGLGSEVVAHIAANTNGPVAIIEALDQSISFWEKVGANDFDQYKNGYLDWQGVAANIVRRQGQDQAAGAVASDQPTSAGYDVEELSQEQLDALGVRFSRDVTIDVDGKQRPTTNSNGKPIAQSEEGIRNFWRWFGDSKVVDADGKPLVVYHGSQRGSRFNTFKKSQENNFFGSSEAYYFTTDKSEAEGYANGNTETQRKGRSGNGFVVDAYLKIDKLADLRPDSWSVKDVDINSYFEDLNIEGIIPALKDKGYNGIAHSDDLASIPVYGSHFIAFSPSQIKSATGNTGAFNPANSDIRFSRALATPSTLTLPEQGLLRRVQASIQDSMNRVKQVQENIEKIIGKPLPEYADYYGAEANRPGRIAARLEDFEKQMTAPLMEKLAKSGHTAEQLSELLHAQHAQERNEVVARINPDMPDGGSGMTNAEAEAILAKNRTNIELLKIAKEARSIASATLDLKLAYGNIKKEDYDVYKTGYDYYVPLKGDGEYGPKIKRAMGHDERNEHILENLARDYQQAVVVGEKNLARNYLLPMVLENPDPALWTVGVPARGRYVAGKVYSVFTNGKQVASFTSSSQVMAFLEAKGPQAVNYEVKDSNGERVQEFIKPLQDNEIMLYVKGDPVRIQIVGDEQLARQLRPLDQGKMNAILEFMRSTNRYLSKIYTGYNPAFIVKNTARDAMTGTINILGNEGAATAARAWASYPAAMKALASYAATGKVPDGAGGKMLQEYRQHGGKTGASYMSDLEEQGKTLQRMFDDAYGASGYLGDKRYAKAAAVAGRKIVGGMAHVVEVLNQATENGLRLALYMALRKQGVSAGEAAQAAKSVTVNFDRKGTMTGALGAIYLFFNPAVQGTANAMKTLIKGEHKAQAWTALGALAMLGAYAASQGMDDDEDKWLGEGWETRAKNLMLNVGGVQIKVPTSQEFAPYYALGVALAEAKRGKSKMAAAGHIVSSFIDAYFPLQGAFNSESDDHGMDAIAAAIPTLIKPGFQIATNRNSFGSQVVPDSPLTADRPDNLKMFRGTKGSLFDVSAQGIAKAGEVTGAGRYENDITKVSPETLKLLWKTYTGGLGAFVTDMAGLANIAAQDAKNIEVGDVPVVKDFIKAGTDVRQIRSRFYEMTDEARKASTEFKQAKKAGDADAMDDILGRPDKAELLGFDRMIKSTAKAAAAIRDEMVDINADKKLGLADKRAKLKALEHDEEAIYRDAIAAFK